MMRFGDDGDGTRGGRPAIRASDADRDAVAARLRDAAGDGRIDLTELDDRLERCFASKTFGELEPLVADLPEDTVGPTALHTDAEPMRLDAGSGTIKQVGHWVVPARIDVVTSMGNVKVDFTAAVCRRSTVEIEVKVGMGNAILIVPHGWQVRSDEVRVGMGNVSNKITESPSPGAPALRIHGRVKSGNLLIRYQSRREAARQAREAQKSDR